MKVYCSGIGGIGLSAYAALMHADGHSVSGSDRIDSALIHDLEAQGISVSLVQDGSAFPEDAELHVYSEAIPTDAPERMIAKGRGVRSVSYFQALGEYATSRNLRLVAVCGTHGKSTTTAMIAKVLVDLGVDPTVVVGTKSADLQGRNWRKGQSDIAVFEACEYRGSFLHVHPDMIVLTNADGDHFDAFPTKESYRAVFETFVQKLSRDGALIIHGSDAESRRIAETSQAQLIDADTEALPELDHLSGFHMQQNAALALIAARHLGCDEKKVRSSLRAFRGTWRRMEYKGDTSSGAPVIDDYAHHPVEIAATIAGIRMRYPDKRLVCVFQPHLWSRTKQLYAEFCTAFRGAERVLLTDVYRARKEEDTLVDLAAFARDIAEGSSTACEFVGGLDAAQQALVSKLSTQDVLLVMGAGDIGDLAEKLVN